MKIYYFFRKYLHEVLRDPAILAIILLFPAAFIAVYYLAYGGGQSGLAQMLSVSVLNQDQGTHGAALVRALQNATFDGVPALSVNTIKDRTMGEISLKENRDAMLLVIPANFSSAIQTQGSTGQVTFELAGDPALDLFSFSQSFVAGIIDAYVKEQIGWRQPPSVAIEFVEHTGTINDFQIAIPGLIIFGILFNMATTALWVVRESTSGTLRRIQLSAAGSLHLFGGITLLQTCINLAQIFLALGIALLFGFHSVGSLPLAVFVCLLAGLAATGLGLLISALVNSTMEATTISTVALLPMAFLSGAAFPVPALLLGYIGQQKISLFDFLAPKHAVDALTRILVYGDGFSQLLYPIGMLALLSILIFFCGAWLFQKRRLEV